MTRAKTAAENEAELGIEKLKQLRALSHMDGWPVLMDLLDRGVEIRRDRLCALDCDPSETNRIRGEIALIQWVREVASVDDQKVQQAAQVLLRLQKDADLRHDLGSLHKRIPT